MFSGIVEEAATVVCCKPDQGNLHLTLKCSFVNELKVDQSVSHNGVCLTIVGLTEDTYTVTAIKETLERSNLGLLKVGDKVNLERSLLMNGRLDGHIVQGHVDQTAICTQLEEMKKRQSTNASKAVYMQFHQRRLPVKSIDFFQPLIRRLKLHAVRLLYKNRRDQSTEKRLIM